MLHSLQCFRVSLLSAGSQSQKWAFEALPCSDSAFIRWAPSHEQSQSHYMNLAPVEDVASVKCSPLHSSFMRLLFCSLFAGQLPSSLPFLALIVPMFRTASMHTNAMACMSMHVATTCICWILLKPRNCFTAGTCPENMSRSGHLDHCLFLGQVEATRAQPHPMQCVVQTCIAQKRATLKVTMKHLAEEPSHSQPRLIAVDACL